MKIRNVSNILIHLVITIVIGIWSSVIISNSAGSDYNSHVGWIGLISLLWCAVSLKIKNGTYLSLVFMFEGAFYILTLGQSLLYALGIEISSTLNLYYANSAFDVNKAYIFSILCFLFLHFGVLLYVNKKTLSKNQNANIEQIKEKKDYTHTMRQLGKILLPVTGVFYLFQVYALMSAYSVVGYAQAYGVITGSTSWAKIPILIGNYFPHVLFFMLAAYRNSKRNRSVYSMLILFIVAFNFSIGNRSEPVSYLMALLWFSRTYATTKTEIKVKSLMMIVGAFLLILIVPIIGETRNTGELSLATIIDSFTGENSMMETVFDTITSMGYSAFPTIKTMQLIPNQFGLRYGKSYFYALLSVFPNLFGGTHISVKHAGLALWLKTTLNMSYGPGFSMPAEAYYNFGWFGIVIMPLFGYLISKILEEENRNESSLRLFVMMSAFVVLFSIPRRDTMTAIRNGLYYTGLLCFGVWFVHNYILKKRRGVSK